MEADLILKGGLVLTMSAATPYAEAVAVKDGRILKVGKEAETTKYRGKNTKIVDLKGKVLVPGFIDTHLHLGDFGKTLAWIDLSSAKSIKEIKNMVKAKAQASPKGRWILGRGWHEKKLVEKRPPKANELDEAAPDNPVILYRLEGKVCTVNTKALTLAGIKRDTESPPGGKIEKDPVTGEPTGVLIGSSTDMVWRVVPEQSLEETLENMDLAFRKILENGITTIHWIVSSPWEKKLIWKVAKRGKLPVRVNLIVPEAMLEEFKGINLSGGSINLKGAMILVDGSLAAGTAALSSPYENQPENKGMLLYTLDDLIKTVKKVHGAGLQIVLHAVGDKAIEVALKAVEKAFSPSPRKHNRQRIENAAVLNPKLIDWMRDLGVVVSLQPYLIFSEFSVWSAMGRLGVGRARWLYPLRTLIDKGVVVAGGSDCPMEPLNPLVHIKAAVARSFFPEEKITVEEALHMFTINAAYVASEEEMKGSIEEGKLADLAVLSRNPLKTPSEELDRIKVEMTIIGGEIAYQHLT